MTVKISSESEVAGEASLRSPVLETGKRNPCVGVLWLCMECNTKRVKSGAGREWSTAHAYGLDILYGPCLIRREQKSWEILGFTHPGVLRRSSKLLPFHN